MKRFLVSLFIMTIIIGLAVVGLVYTENCCQDVIDSLNLAKQSLDNQNFSTARKYCERALSEFEGKEKILSVFLNHIFIEEIQIRLTSLVEYAKPDSKTIFLASLEESKIKLQHLKESQLHIP